MVGTDEGATVVGRYQVLRLIGEGGMAQVYLSLLRGVGGFEKPVVLKILHGKYIHDSDYINMFLHEARLLSRLQHPNIVGVFEVESVDGIPYVAMEYVPGPTLGKLATTARKAGRDHPAFLMHLVAQVCHGLHHAHTLKIKGAPAGIVHRDVSSQNVLVDVETGKARLIDFGIAKSELGSIQTEVGLLKGKVIYMAPEILRGAKPSPRIDIYAVGVLLYAVLTGRLPFSETDDIWAARIAGRYPRPSQVRPELSAAVDRMIYRALHPDPEHRYQTAAEFAADLESEVKLLGADTERITDWIRSVFPKGEEEWAPQVEGYTPHSALSRITNPGSGGRTPIRAPPPRSMRKVAGLVTALVGLSLAVALTAMALAGAATLVYSQEQKGETEREAARYLDAADQLLATHAVAAAREMNARATALEVHDADLVVRATRQKLDIDHEATQAAVEGQIAAGQLEEARATLEAALAGGASDPTWEKMLADVRARLSAAEPAPTAATPAPAAPVQPVEHAERVRAAPSPAPTPKGPAPAAQKELVGGVDVVTTPPGLVFFDGKLVGESPVHVGEVPAGSHSVEARLDGYKPGRASVSVGADAVAQVQLSLVAEP